MKRAPNPLAGKTQKQLIEETHDTVITLSTVLLGVPNSEDSGLVGEVKTIKLNNNSTNKRITKLQIILGSLGGSALLGSGLWQLLIN